VPGFRSGAGKGGFQGAGRGVGLRAPCKGCFHELDYAASWYESPIRKFLSAILRVSMEETL